MHKIKGHTYGVGVGYFKIIWGRMFSSTGQLDATQGKIQRHSQVLIVSRGAFESPRHRRLQAKCWKMLLVCVGT